jgi:D-methionine transport system ATP-binding protein
MIKISHLTKVYHTGRDHVVALDDVSLEVKKGEIFGVIGFSGAGKSSLIRCVNLLEKPSKGSIVVNGQEMTRLTETELRQARRKIGMIFQHFNLLQTATVFENVAIPLKLIGKPVREIEEKVSELLRLVGLEDKGNMYPGNLSGGQKQRVAIARALANDPEILLSDEATSALDPQTTDSILDLLLDINRKFHLTILLITHEMHVIKKICDRVAVLEAGRIIEQGEVLDLFTNPKTETTKNFLHNLFDDKIPASLLREFHQNRRSGALIRLTFTGHTTGEPVIAELVRHFSVSPNILFGNVTHVKDTPFGRLVVHLEGEDETVNTSIQYLKEKGLRIEVLTQ